MIFHRDEIPADLLPYFVRAEIGLEQTPDEYVAEMVAVFREVRRVLRDDGTLWLNLGDSYANDGKWGGSSGGKHASALHGKSGIGRGKVTTGLKPKDLIGIPWSVARALQDPFYTGRIKSELDRVWLAATIDAEGSICGFTHERKDDGTIRTGIHLTITNTNRPLLDNAFRIWPTSREDHNLHGEGHLGSADTYRWIAHNVDDKAELLREIYPYLIAKKKQALLAWNFLEMSREAKRLARTGEADAVKEKRAWIVAALSRLNHFEGVDVPGWCREPPSLFEPGFYLRQDIIWHKPNPMPESVRDRCTKAHEYVFLMSKSPRYFYDSDAIAEPQVSDHTAGNNSHKGASAYDAGATEHRTKAGLVAFAQRSRSQAKRAAELAQKAGLTDEHIAAIRAVGITDTGKARVTQAGTGKNDPAIQAPADEAKAALGGYYREFLISDMRNRRSVWTVPTMPFKEAHFATMAPELAETCIKAGCPQGGVVLDPFGGAGTTGLCADRLGRDAILIELNPEYVAIARNRLTTDAGMFADVA